MPLAHRLTSHRLDASPTLDVLRGLAAVFMVDRATASLRQWPAWPVVAGLVAASYGFLSIARVRLHHGAHINRWGCVTPGYFVYSLSVLVGAIAASAVVALVSRRLASVVGLRGVAACAVVPVHYGLICAGTLGGLVIVDGVGYAVAAGAVLVAAFWLSGRYAAAVRRAATTRWARPACSVAALACAAASWTVAWPHPALPWLEVAVLAQLGVGVWLVNAPKRTEST